MITGKVQGVGFRANTEMQASRLHVCGWVKNLADGRVEVLAQADEAILKEFVAWCKVGPAKAVVSETEVRWEEVIEKYSSFSVNFD